MRRLEVWVLVALIPGAASGKDVLGGAVSRVLELPAHRALIARIGRDDAELAPFETDGCSGGLSDVWRLVSAQLPDFAAAHETAPPWEACCVVHDRAYHGITGAGTAEDSYAARLQADAALRSCVIDTGTAREEELAAHYEVSRETVAQAYDAIGEAMYLAVRFGGGPCTGLPWRWGYGWPNCSILQLNGDD
jgi:hypothetical protein